MADLGAALRAAGVSFESDARRRAEYSFDASNYRVPPLGVAFPRDADETAVVVRECARANVPITSRGGGTSMAGNAIGPGVVIDFTRHMNRVVHIDVDAATATVEPGVVLTELADAVGRCSGGALTFAPDPSSKSRATVGGSIGNDACGNHSVRYGRTSDHVVAVDLVTIDGYRLTATRTGLLPTDPTDLAAMAKAADLSAHLRSLAARHLTEFRLELGRIPRQVSGYHLVNLLPDKGFDVARALVGSEGTCAVIVAATVSLVPVSPAALLLCIGYRDVVDAARDVPTILEYSPAAVEGIDALIVATMRHRRGPDSVGGLPAGDAWLYVDLDGDDTDEIRCRADELLHRLRAAGRLVDAGIITDARERALLWRVREDGAGLSARLADGTETWPGWEDSAVAPHRLADYLVEFRSLLDEFGLTGVMYGHFGAGCMHIRITFDQRTERGRAVMTKFVRRAAQVCAAHGGSVSGEHGDGRARSQLLPVMYSPAVLSAFDEFKRLWDPVGLLNPGCIVAPVATDVDLALEIIGADNRGCIGVGRCRSTAGGVMCPSFRATGDEKDSTRGRARVLQEMIGTGANHRGADEVRESLDLCLSCKACSTDCPTGVDMASYKADFLNLHYKRRIRPRSHYSLGWLPLWLQIASRVAPLANAALRVKGAQRAAGITNRRTLPAITSARRLDRELGARHADADTVLLLDTFTRAFRPEVAGAALRVLGDAGRTTEARTDVCCGLTWISTGQLRRARKVLERSAAALDDGTDRPIVVPEPSCASAFRHDLPRLVPTDAARRVADRIRSFAGFVPELIESGWQPTASLPASVTVQTHCHEYASFGPTVQAKGLAAVGVTDVREATGCCGVAGNFGFETQHYDLSMRVAEQALGPALRATSPETPVLTDGFSCRMQVDHLAPDRRPLHLAQLLDPQKDSE
ncbi:FAD-binding and (Fe-S)-binding domain-containing protein [Antrihabitans sp. YC2-6]|uniref:FAD-binding and (Fe-S)-binding domain-containing protein n=1 Tax=Antrihabitans sp. YC2-6 TaxID=2799498 RepID=UPI0018F5D1AF|nr:FAD-binding and (Fe-S)-binding domain-containing protein [Antrihabitans sp. YC2-6]MBJ8345724.1 FAD-binding oxidoreductase [Antrihabitans sp. YC2-6]